MASLLTTWRPRPRTVTVGIFVALSFLAVSLFGSHSLVPTRSPPLPSIHRATDATHWLYDDAINSTLGFERIYVVSLPERTDKRDNLILQAAVSGLKLNFIDGVKASAIIEKILPVVHSDDYKSTWAAAWRAHMNAISQIVHQDLGSALIVEDDIDWDTDFKTVVRNVAVSINAIIRDETASELDLSNVFASSTVTEQHSPYGDDWDVIWLGHCGTKISLEESHVVQYNDPTVPQPHHLHSWDPAERTPLAIYPNHTRLVGRLDEGTCSLAYAVSQAGARKILYNMGMLYLDMGYDLMLSAFCGGSVGRSKHRCFGVLPPVFEHYRKAGNLKSDSDLSEAPTGYRDRGFTMNLRRTVALNMDKILEGSTDYRDQFPDT